MVEFQELTQTVNEDAVGSDEKGIVVEAGAALEESLDENGELEDVVPGDGGEGGYDDGVDKGKLDV
jgi:hypothetical protein